MVRSVLIAFLVGGLMMGFSGSAYAWALSTGPGSSRSNAQKQAPVEQATPPAKGGKPVEQTTPPAGQPSGIAVGDPGSTGSCKTKAYVHKKGELPRCDY